MQKRRPLLTQWESTLVIYYLGDLSAQVAGTNVFIDGPYEPIRGLRALIIGAIISIPSYKWFLWLGRQFNYKSHTLSIAAKVLFSQMVFTPLFNTYFFGMQSLLSGSTFAETKRRVVETVPVSWKNSWYACLALLPQTVLTLLRDAGKSGQRSLRYSLLSYSRRTEASSRASLRYFGRLI